MRHKKNDTPKKIRIRDWMGEDWTVEYVGNNDHRLRAHNCHGVVIFTDRSMVIERTGANETIMTTLHEVAHMATRSWEGDLHDEELKIDTIALTFKQFLERMGVDLSPLAGGK